MLELDECPRKAVRPESWEWLNLWHQYQKGHLPYPGGLLDQPSRFFRAMGVIDAAKAEG